ncbi:MAG: DUF131 domain-containing protein [Nitrososphaerales archaeon]|jgi:uncharacterized protein (TIGR00304 family)
MPGPVLLGELGVLAGVALILPATVPAARREGDGREGEEEEEKGNGMKGAPVRGGAVVTIGPIPIVFGSDARWTVQAIALAIILIVLSALMGHAA